LPATTDDNGDGKSGQAGLPKRHVQSQPYLLHSKGEINMSGIEAVGAAPGEDAASLRVKPGPYTIVICLIAWDDEPGAKDKKGQPTKEALPDFIVLANRQTDTTTEYCQDLKTFKESPVK
jgi:hypothetical protein